MHSSTSTGLRRPARSRMDSSLKIFVVFWSQVLSCFKRWQSIVDRKFWFEHAFRLVVLARGGAAAGGLLGRGRCDLVPGRATHSDRVVAQGRLVSGGTGVVMHNTQHPAKWGWGGA